MASVAGCRRVPEPPARMMPLRSGHAVSPVQRISQHACDALLPRRQRQAEGRTEAWCPAANCGRLRRGGKALVGTRSTCSGPALRGPAGLPVPVPARSAHSRASGLARGRGVVGAEGRSRACQGGAQRGPSRRPAGRRRSARRTGRRPRSACRARAARRSMVLAKLPPRAP
jgi:hypothetical protein